MRCDKEIYFRIKTPGEYDARSGNYLAGTETLSCQIANVTDTKEKELILLYGGIKQGALTIRLQSHYDNYFDDILIDNKPYRVDSRRKLRTKDVFFVSEEL